MDLHDRGPLDWFLGLTAVGDWVALDRTSAVTLDRWDEEGKRVKPKKVDARWCPNGRVFHVERPGPA